MMDKESRGNSETVLCCSLEPDGAATLACAGDQVTDLCEAQLTAI